MINPLRIPGMKDLVVIRGWCMKSIIRKEKNYVSLSFRKDTTKTELFGVMCFYNQASDESKITVGKIAESCEKKYCVVICKEIEYKGKKLYRAININTIQENEKKEEDTTEEDLIKQQQEEADEEMKRLAEEDNEEDEEELPFNN